MDKWLRKIVSGPNPILGQICEEVSAEEPLAWLEELERITRKCKMAAGLAAPQIGVAKRAFFTLTADEKKSVRGRLFINPQIIKASAEMNLLEEGCLSYLGIKKVKVVERHDWVRVRYCERDFIPRERVFAGFFARVIQHEMDHLDGICKVGDADYPADGEIVKAPRRPGTMILAAAVAMGSFQ